MGILCEISLPNREIALVYHKEILQKFETMIPQSTAIAVQEAIFSGDNRKLKTQIQTLLMESASSFDTAGENFYHGFMLGLCALMSGTFATSNRESGDGRYDIQLKPIRKGMPGILIELKAGKNCSDEELKNMSRSASYYESGIGRGMGFRDSCQDLLGFVHLIPDRARQRILDIASTQFEDGSAYHQYQPLTKKGNSDIGSGFNDDPLWLIAGTAAYIKETGDYSILDERTPYDNDNSKATDLMEHLRRSFHYTMEHRGPHKLPLIGRADWNDCLNLNCFSTEPGESFQTFGPSEGPNAESVFIAGMFVRYGKDYVEICRHRGMAEEAALAEEAIADMEKTVLDAGWDGEWFLRAYDHYKNKIGSKECEDGKIFIEPQGFCVMAEIGLKEGNCLKAMESVEKYLDTKYGIVLLQPPYHRYHVELGEISSYPPGYKENAGIFCHNNPWISIAETVVGRGNRAWQVYTRTCPAYIEDISEIHRTEPYVYSQMIAGKDAPNFGEAKNSWLTGTAAWTFLDVSQYILGIRPDYDGLTVDPCIPSTLDGFEAKRDFRGVTYHISVRNPKHVEKGVASMTVDGIAVDGNTIPLPTGKTEVSVEVVMG